MEQTPSEPLTPPRQPIAIVDAPGTSAFLDTSFTETAHMRHDGCPHVRTC